MKWFVIALVGSAALFALYALSLWLEQRDMRK